MGITLIFVMCAFSDDEPPVKSGLPITVHVGYPWTKVTAEQKAGDAVWSFARQIIGTASHAVAKIQANRGVSTLPVRINRLRAMHGGSVLDVLLRRIRRSDILLFDITGLNPNVLIEIGMALALKGTVGSVFILQRTDSRGKPLKVAAHPSDLSGYFFTRYEAKVLRGRSSFRLIEPQGFLAALRARLIDAARERGIWEDVQRTLSDEAADDSPPKARMSATRRASKKISKKKRTKQKP